MGCNCKTTEKIIDIQNRYGTKQQVSAIEKIKFYLEELPKLILIAILSVVFSPILLIVGIIVIVKENGVININKLLNRFIKQKRNE
jgi:lipopolysaccharide/colanic/teichoic acid biosynthesis glycosyltransferase